MIKLIFGIGSALREVRINKRKIGFLSNETGFVPLMIDLDKIKSIKGFRGLNNKQRELVDALKGLKTEDELADDVVKDFQEKGWRLIDKKET